MFLVGGLLDKCKESRDYGMKWAPFSHACFGLHLLPTMLHFLSKIVRSLNLCMAAIDTWMHRVYHLWTSHHASAIR